MKSTLKWIGRGTLALVLLLLVAVGVVYALSGRTLGKRYDHVPRSEFVVPTDPAVIAEGERRARLRGCFDGCHGDGASGEIFVDEPMLGTIKTPDLTRVVNTLSDAELERVIRHGVRANGKSVYVMPSDMFYHLTDEDLGSILAFLRSLPRTDGPETSVRLGPLGRALMLAGEIQPIADDIDHEAERVGPGDGSDPVALGRYLAMTSCVECHGPDLAGSASHFGSTPNLAIAATYTPEQFRELMRTGVSRDGRDIGLMGLVGRKRFSRFTDDEVDGLYAYLTVGLSAEAEAAAD